LKRHALGYWFNEPQRTPPFPFRPIYGKLFQIILCRALWNIQMWSSHRYFIILPSCQLYIFNFSILPNCQVQLMGPWIYPHGMELDPWKVMKSWGEINSFQKYLFHPWNVVYSKIYFLHRKPSKFHGCTCIKYHGLSVWMGRRWKFMHEIRVA
jgi:hypothetical protein